MRKTIHSFAVAALAAIGLALSPPPAAAQMNQLDPNSAIDADLDNPPPAPPAVPAPDPGTSYDESLDSDLARGDQQYDAAPDNGAATVAADADSGSTYKKDDLIGAAEGVFGKGAQGLAGLIEDILRKQGEPNAYIVGRDLAAGAGAVLHHHGGAEPVLELVGQQPGDGVGTAAGRKAHEQADGAGPPGQGRQRGSDGGGTDQPVAAGKGHHGLRTGDGRLGGSPARSR